MDNSAGYENEMWVCRECGTENDDTAYECDKEGCHQKKPYRIVFAEDPLVEVKNKVERLKATLFQTCGADDGTSPPLNIVFLGRPGAGKSSLINSFAAPLGDGWYTYAPTGPGSKGKPKSIHFRSFHKCCTAMETKRTNERLQLLKAKYENILLPNLIDVAGLSDEAEEAMRKFLKLLLYGHIWKEAKTIKVYEDCATLEDEELFRKYAKCYEDMRMDVVVFVASVDDPLPDKLMKCVADIAGASHTEEAARGV